MKECEKSEDVVKRWGRWVSFIHSFLGTACPQTMLSFQSLRVHGVTSGNRIVHKFSMPLRVATSVSHLLQAGEFQP
jgi:hypothetical protein